MMEILDTPGDNSAMDAMSQFMDVITTFKCKGCDFVCYKQVDLMSHIRIEHLPHQATNSSNPVNTEVETTDADALHATDVECEAADAATNSLIASLVDEATQGDPTYGPGSNLQEISIQTYGVDGTPTDQVVLLDSGTNRSDIFSPTEGEQQREVFLCGQCNLGFSSIDECKGHMVEVHKVDMENLSAAHATSVDLDVEDLNVQTQTMDDPQLLIDAVDCLDPQPGKSTEQEPTYTLISEREEMENGKVSMSTQVVRKKVGRKSKAELLEIAKKENEKPAEGLEDTLLTVTTDNILDPEDGEDEEVTYVEIEIPGKRKRRVPKHLVDDYWVPRAARHMTDLGVADNYGVDRKRISKRRGNWYRSSRTRDGSPLSRTEYAYKCDKCRARFMVEQNLLYHNRTHSEYLDKSGDTVQVFVCPEPDCKAPNKFQVTQWVDFKHHAWKGHGVSTDYLKGHGIDLGMIRCDVCDYRATVRSKLVIHKQIHSADKPFVCDICHKGFKQQSQLKNHALIHVAGVDIKEKESMSGRHWFVQAQCEICKRTFANPKSLQCHVEAVHDKVRPFACKFCGHKAARKAMMQLHMRTHTGEKPFKCNLCEYVTGDHNSMRRHRMRHTGDKPYQCPHCSYACIQAVSLKLHLKSKHPGSDRCFSCNKCPYRSVNENLFNNHMRDHTMGLIDESLLIPSSEDHSNTVIPDSQVGFSIKLGAIKDLTNGTSNTTQLICSALNAIAPSLTEDGEPLPENIETTVQTISELDGLKAHKISFQIPATATKNAKTAEVVVQEQIPTITEMDTLQTAALESQIPTDTLDIDEHTTVGEDQLHAVPDHTQNEQQDVAETHQEMPEACIEQQHHEITEPE